MLGKLRIDAYVCNNCGFKFLGSTRFKPDIKRLVLCPKCSSPTRIDKYATVKEAAVFLVLGTVAVVIGLYLAKYFGWI